MQINFVDIISSDIDVMQINFSDAGFLVIILHFLCSVHDVIHVGTEIAFTFLPLFPFRVLAGKFGVENNNFMQINFSDVSTGEMGDGGVICVK
jgi:hypothetical protein